MNRNPSDTEPSGYSVITSEQFFKILYRIAPLSIVDEIQYIFTFISSDLITLLTSTSC